MKIRPLYLLIFFLLGFVAIELFYTRIPFPYEKTVRTMGTTVRVKVVGPGAPHWTKRAIDEISRIDRLFSKFNPDSEISLLNRLAGRAPLQVSADTFNVLKLAEEVKRASHGAFDVSYGTQRIDLGGIGKGYAVESARRLLLKKEIKSAIIDMHSSIAVIGDGWKVGVRDPRDKDKLLGVVVLNDGEALSTSAQYEQPGHIIDPRTGKPAAKCLSATVIARDAALADALSTAVFVLGPKKGIKLIKRWPQVAALLVDAKGNVTTTNDNSGFKLR